MAITQAMCTSFKKALLDGAMDFSATTTQVFKIALYTSAAELSTATTAYNTSNEVVGDGYTAGGSVLTVVPPVTSGTSAYIDFADITWPGATITARGALIYHADGAGNPAVAVLDFGGDKTSTQGDFTVHFPAADAASAIIRIV